MSNILEITDFNDPQLVVYARLTENQLLTDTNLIREYLLQKAPKSLNVL